MYACVCVCGGGSGGGKGLVAMVVTPYDAFGYVFLISS